MARLKGDGTIYKRKDRDLWVCQLSIGINPETGKIIKKAIYAKTKSELLEKKREFEKLNGLIDKKDITFEQNFYKYLYLIKKPELKEKSWERYEGLYKNYISKAPFIHSYLRDISYTDIRVWYNSSNISKSSLEVINRLIKASLNIAVRDKIISENVLKDVSMKYKPTAEKYNVLTVEEQSKFVNYLNSCTLEQEPLKYMFLFALGTGLRLGEILALEKTDIKDNIVVVNKSVHRIKKDGKYVQETTTTKTTASIRQVPIPQNILHALSDMPKTNSKLLFSDEKTGSFIFTNRPLKRILSICDKLNITRITFHGLRHTYATRLFELNVQIKTVQKLMGHSDIQTTMNIYTHVMQNVIDDAVENLNNFL